MIRSSMRASGAPRHTWVPKPKATWCLMLRVTSKRSGSSKTRSSWLADGYMSSSSSPAFSCWPFSSWSRVTVRRMLSTGDTNRTNSSTAVVPSSDGSSRSWRCTSGSSASWRQMAPMTARVVSAPPSTMSRHSSRILSSGQGSPPCSVWAQMEMRSSCGSARRAAMISMVTPAQRIITSTTASSNEVWGEPSALVWPAEYMVTAETSRISSQPS